MRPTFEEIYMELAILMSKRSTCERLKVGCVITSTDFRKVLAVGYNGNASGFHNGCDGIVPGQCGCLHAEENAIISCTAQRYEKKYIFVTNSPCVMCAKRIINLGGVEHVYYKELYRIHDSIYTLKQAGIPVTQLKNEEKL